MQQVIQDVQTSDKEVVPLRLKRIIAPTDFSPRSEKAIRYAVQLAKLVGARLTLVHVIPEPSALDYSIEGFPGYQVDEWRQEADEKLQEELAKAKLGARLMLLHVIPEMSANAYSIEGLPAYQVEEWRQESGKKLHKELAKAKLEYDAVDTLMITASHMRDEIIRTAKETPADLLVLSTHGYTGWKHVLLGSDAEKILEQAPCPVLVVR